MSQFSAHESAVTCVCISKDEQLLATGGMDNHVKVGCVCVCQRCKFLSPQNAAVNSCGNVDQRQIRKWWFGNPDPHWLDLDIAWESRGLTSTLSAHGLPVHRLTRRWVCHVRIKSLVVTFQTHHVPCLIVWALGRGMGGRKWL